MKLKIKFLFLKSRELSQNFKFYGSCPDKTVAKSAEAAAISGLQPIKIAPRFCPLKRGALPPIFQKPLSEFAEGVGKSAQNEVQEATNSQNKYNLQDFVKEKPNKNKSRKIKRKNQIKKCGIPVESTENSASLITSTAQNAEIVVLEKTK